MKHKLKQYCSFLIVLVLVATVLPLTAFASSTGTACDGNIEITSTSSTYNVAVSGTTATAKAEGGIIGRETITVTVENASDATAGISFTWAVTGNYASFTDPNGSSSASGNYSATLAAGGTVTMTLKGKASIGAGAATLTLTNLSYVAAADSSDVTVNYDSNYGTVVAGSTTITAGSSVEANATDGVVLTATAKNGGTFLGWVNPNTNELLSASASYSLYPAEDTTVQAAFAASGSNAWFYVGAGTTKEQAYGLLSLSKFKYYTVSGFTYLCDDLNAAATAAQNSTSKYIVLANSGTLPAGDYTIPSGVTLVIPFDSSNTNYTENGQWVESYTTPTAYRTLTMASGANLTVNGAMSVSGKYTYAAGGMASAVSGPVGMVKMESGSTITVNGGLYAYGFIYGSGTVDVSATGLVHEIYQLGDCRGGSQTTGMENGVFPFSQYWMQNIEVFTTYHSGARLHGNLTIYMSNMTFLTGIDLIGEEGGAGLIRLQSGTTATKVYDGTKDRTFIDVYGDCDFSPVEISVNGITINTGEYIFPQTNSWEFSFHSGTATFIQEVSPLPGAAVNIYEGATVTLAEGKRVYFYDTDEWGTYCYSSEAGTDVKFLSVKYSPTKTYTRTEADLVDGRVTVNGTFDASAGYLYTTATGANICSEGSGVMKVNPGSDTVTYQFRQTASTYDEIPITPAQLKNGDGSYVATANSKTAPNTYNYVDGKWVCETHSGVDTDHTCDVCGFVTDCVDEVPEGAEYADHKCDICGETISECADENGDSICDICGASLCTHANATGTEAVAESCTSTGNTAYWSCSACGKFFSDEACTKEIEEDSWITPIIDHNYDNGTMTTAPSCTATGVMTYECINCDHSYTSEIAATGHTPGEAATCIEAQTCTICSTVIEAALGHNAVTDAAVAPDCTSTGLTEGSHCERCGVVLDAQEVVPATGHSYEAVVTAPTCTEEGYTTYTCTCGDAYTDDVVAAVGHDYKAVVTAPTCTEQGYTTYTCACGDTKVEDYVDATGHSYTEEVIAATCTTQGYTKYTCACGHTYNDNYVAKAGHTWNEGVETTAPDCVSEGVMTYTCTECDETKTETIAATGHSWNEGEQTTAPDCDSEGVMTYTCTKCGETKTEAISAKGHTSVDVERVAPTCTQPGREAGQKCSVCNAVLSGMAEIPATGHKYEAVVTAPTCTEDGYTTYTCSCGDSYTGDPVAAVGHKYEDVVTDPTCTEGGYTTYTCSVCSDTYTDDVVAALGHSYDTGVVTPPTCTEQGYTTHTCSVCGDSCVDTYVNATGHSYTNYVSDGNASCTEDGTKTAQCDNGCGQSSTVTETGSAIGHKYEENIASDVLAQAATCTTPAMYYIKCDVCGTPHEQQTVEVGDPNGHSYVDHEAKVPSCTEIGWSAYQTCNNCDYTSYVEIAALGHTNGTPVVENNVAPDCVNGGSYDNVVYCTVCKAEVSRDTVTVNALGHTEGDVVVENNVAPDCTTEGSYDNVTYCTVCGEQLSRETITVDALGHTEGEVVVENNVAPDCVNGGSYDNVVYCTVCGEELSRETVVVPATGHTEEVIPAEDADCVTDGATSGVKCSVCDTVLTAPTVIPATGHVNTITTTVDATCVKDGSVTVTCDDCGATISTEPIPATGEHSYVDGVCTGCGAIKETVFLQAYNKTVYQIGLMEPWSMRINVRVTDDSYTTIDYTTMEDYGVYAIRRNRLSDPNAIVTDLTIHDLMNEEHVIHFSKADGTATQSGKYVTFTYTEGLFTYRLKEDIIWVLYYQTADGIYATPVQARNLYDLMYERKDSTSATYGAEEKAVYADMVELYNKVTDYRSDFDTLEDGVPQNTATLSNTTIPFAEAASDGKYGFARVQQIGLIEPWGMRLNTRIYTSDNTSGVVDYNALTDYGVIVFHDKDGSISRETLDEPTEMLNIADKDNTYVFSSTQDTTEVDGRYAASAFNKDIYTYQLDSTLYYMFFAQDGEDFYYSQVYATNIRTLAAERSVSTSSTYKPKEKVTYAAMVELCDSIAAYREWYRANNAN